MRGPDQRRSGSPRCDDSQRLIHEIERNPTGSGFDAGSHICAGRQFNQIFAGTSIAREDYRPSSVSKRNAKAGQIRKCCTSVAETRTRSSSYMSNGSISGLGVRFGELKTWDLGVTPTSCTSTSKFSGGSSLLPCRLADRRSGNAQAGKRRPRSTHPIALSDWNDDEIGESGEYIRHPIVTLSFLKLLMDQMLRAISTRVEVGRRSTDKGMKCAENADLADSC